MGVFVPHYNKKVEKTGRAVLVFTRRTVPAPVGGTKFLIMLVRLSISFFIVWFPLTRNIFNYASAEYFNVNYPQVFLLLFVPLPLGFVEHLKLLFPFVKLFDTPGA